MTETAILTGGTWGTSDLKTLLAGGQSANCREFKQSPNQREVIEMKTEFISIKSDLKAWQKKTGVKLSITTRHYNSLTVAIMEAPGEVTFNQDYFQANQYYIAESSELTLYGKELCNEINDIIKKYHWDKSDSQSDYFHCAFYYHIHIGKWDKDFVCTADKFKKAA